MKPLAEFDAETQRLIERARAEPGPSEAACRRMEQKLAPMFAAGPGARVLEPSVDLGSWPPSSALSGRGGLRQLLWRGAPGGAVVAATSAALLAGAFWLGRLTAKPEGRPPDAPRNPIAALPVPPLTQFDSGDDNAPSDDASSDDHASGADPGLPSRPATVEPVSSIAFVPSPKPAPLRAAPAKTPAKTVDAVSALGEIEVALRRGKPELALAKLDELGRPAQPRLRALAKLLRAVALCEAGQLEVGRARVPQLERQGLSMFEARLARACRLSEAAPPAGSSQ